MAALRTIKTCERQTSSGVSLKTALRVFLNQSITWFRFKLNHGNNVHFNNITDMVLNKILHKFNRTWV